MFIIYDNYIYWGFDFHKYPWDFPQEGLDSMYSCLSVLVNSQKYLVKFLRDLHEEVVVEFYLKWN